MTHACHARPPAPTKIPCPADTSPASPNALLSVLLVKREVPEKLLTKFWSIEHPAQAAQLSARRKRHAQHKAVSHKQMAIEAGYPDNCRSIFGLPMLADDSRYYVYWSSLIILIDATYTSLWVPVSAAFESAHFITSSTGALDFSMGVIFLTDILMRFHMPIRLTGAFLGTTLHRGPVVARFYVLHGSFLVDFLAAVPLVILPVVEGADRAVIFVLILRILRLLRVQRIISMMSNVQVRPALRPTPAPPTPCHTRLLLRAPAMVPSASSLRRRHTLQHSLRPCVRRRYQVPPGSIPC